MFFSIRNPREFAIDLDELLYKIRDFSTKDRLLVINMLHLAIIQLYKQIEAKDGSLDASRQYNQRAIAIQFSINTGCYLPDYAFLKKLPQLEEINTLLNTIKSHEKLYLIKECFYRIDFFQNLLDPDDVSPKDKQWFEGWFSAAQLPCDYHNRTSPNQPFSMDHYKMMGLLDGLAHYLQQMAITHQKFYPQ